MVKRKPRGKGRYVEKEGMLLLDSTVEDRISETRWLLETSRKRYRLVFNEGDLVRAKRFKATWVSVLGYWTGEVINVSSLHGRS